MIPASQAKAWGSQFAHPSQFVNPPFVTGDGEAFPLASMPIAQAFRYWFAVQKWALSWDLDIDFSGEGTDVRHAQRDFQWVPYGCGGLGDGSFTDRNLTSNWLKPPYPLTTYGDQKSAPTLRERFQNEDITSFNYIGIANTFFPTSGDGYGEIVAICFPPALYFNSAAEALREKTLVLDAATPGNVYMGFLASVGTLVTSPDVFFSVGAPRYDSGIDLMFDGAAVKLYQATEEMVVTGTIELKTSEEPI